MNRYNNYHKHDHISNIFTPDCNTKQEDYCKRAIELGHTSYFTTNHGSGGDIFEAKTICDKYGLKCLFGMEGYIVPNPTEKDRRNFHIVLIPRTNKGRKQVNLASSYANMNGFYYKPRLFLDDLLKISPEDLYVTTACIAGLFSSEDAIEQLVIPLVEHFKSSLMFEVQNHNNEKQKEINKLCLQWAANTGLKIIAANDSHYIYQNENLDRLELLKGKGINYNDEDEFVLDYPDYNEMFRRFQIQGVLSDEQIAQAINNTLLFDDCEEIDIDREIKMPSIYQSLSPNQRETLLEDMVEDAFRKTIIQENLTEQEIEERRQGIDYELKTIRDTNEMVHTADYFLLNTKLVNLAVNKYGGVLTRGGRGSCASFYVNKLLNITQLDRFRINLPIYPDRFMSVARLIENRAMPDIDMNVEAQEPFVTASRELLGENGCYPMIAYGTMKLSEAFRNVCRSKNIPYVEYNDVAKNIETHMDEQQWRPIIKEANKYVGTIVSASVHPCAHLLSNKNILEELGIVKIGDNLCVMITSGEADEYKYLKNDYLIVKVWKLIHETFEKIGIPIISAKQLLEDIKNDDRIWDLFKNGITCTLNQVDSDLATGYAKKYGIDSFESGAFLAAAVRPAFDSWRDQFLRREPYDTGSMLLNDVLKQTHGYILFQESLMTFFDWLGIPPADSIGLIKKISKKKIKPEDFANLEDRLKENWVKKTGNLKGFQHTWDLMQSTMSYGFASPHAAATSLDMCYGAWLKVHYPCEYYCTCFENYAGDEERTNKLKRELGYFKIKLIEAKFRRSRGTPSYDSAKKEIYKGLGSVKFISNDIAEELYALRYNTYYTFVNLLYDLKEKTNINSRCLDTLIKIDFFSEFGDINKLLDVYEKFQILYDRKVISKSCLDELEISKDMICKFAKETASQFRFTDNGSRNLLKEYEQIVNVNPASIREQLKYQQEFLGYIDIIDETLDMKYIFISDIDTKYSPKVTAYCLKNGKTCVLKIYKKKPRKLDVETWFENLPVEKGDLLYMNKCKKQPKKRMNENGKWVNTDEMEWWITGYRKVGDLEIAT